MEWDRKRQRQKYTEGKTMYRGEKDRIRQDETIIAPNRGKGNG